MSSSPHGPENGPGAAASETATYVPLDGRGWRHTMGLRPLDLAHWLEAGPDAPAQIAQKVPLLRDHYDDVVALRDGSDAACDELLAAVQDSLLLSGRTITSSVAGDHPLVAASRLIAEDLCVLQSLDGAWQLRAACVCFPSRWSLGDKIGTSLDAIHGPVPGYAASLARATNHFFDRLTPERSFWRLNWTLLDDAELFQPAAPRRAPDADPATWQFRVERQTLRRLPDTGAVIFTIRTHVRPAVEVAAISPTFLRDVLAVLTTAPPETLRYKGWVGLAQRWADRFDVTVSPDSDPA